MTNEASAHVAKPGRKRGIKLIRVKNRLGEMMRMPGGITRDQAVEASTHNVETLRNAYLRAIPGEIDSLEQMTRAAGPVLTAEDLSALLARARRLLTLAGTFGYLALDSVVKKFCDLCSGMPNAHMRDQAPIHVHIRAMRLLAPGGQATDDPAAAEILLMELTRIHEFLGCSAVGNAAKSVQ